jgi:cobalt/nickel transport protein
MKTETRNLIIGGVAVALIIAILSPYIASTNPDGLGATAQHLNPSKWNSTSNDFTNPGYWNAPFAGYMVSQLGDTKLAGIVALVIGCFIAMGVALGVSEIIKRRKRSDVN